ncbi:uncharacterized protein LOC110703645 [Chenopodium quinoa]|uniref:uncharacterized protein LOC110703645 n=1 Tax=Chenopodium quinoa TaxID=63459 RepID=UPI000B7966E0|nr:uncharacterized protein LOC110703645 [Chenopodium quinoa]
MDEFVVGQPGQTLGESAKQRGLLVATQLRNCSWKPTNFNCRVSAFVDLIKAMKIDEKKIELLQDSGFGSLVKLPSTKIDRRFCYWLMGRIDPEKKVLTAGDGRELPLCPEQ